MLLLLLARVALVNGTRHLADWLGGDVNAATMWPVPMLLDVRSGTPSTRGYDHPPVGGPGVGMVRGG